MALVKKVLVRYVVVIAEQNEKGKKSPISQLDSQRMKTFDNKELVLEFVGALGRSTYKEAVIKRIFSVNEYGVTVPHEVGFNGRLYLTPIPAHEQTTIDDDLPDWGLNETPVDINDCEAPDDEYVFTNDGIAPVKSNKVKRVDIDTLLDGPDGVSKPPRKRM
jgi:hypothetical protein